MLHGQFFEGFVDREHERFTSRTLEATILDSECGHCETSFDIVAFASCPHLELVDVTAVRKKCWELIVLACLGRHMRVAMDWDGHEVCDGATSACLVATHKAVVMSK